MVAIRLDCNPTEVGRVGSVGMEQVGPGERVADVVVVAVRQRSVVAMAKVLAEAVEMERDRLEDVILEQLKWWLKVWRRCGLPCWLRHVRHCRWQVWVNVRCGRLCRAHGYDVSCWRRWLLWPVRVRPRVLHSSVCLKLEIPL